MTARPNRLGGIARMHFAAVLIVFTGAVSKAQTTQPRAMHDAAILYVRPLADAGAPSSGPSSSARIDDAVWLRAIATQAALIGREPTFAHLVYDSNNEIRKTQWFAGFKQPADAIGWLEQHVHVAPMEGTALIEVWLDAEQLDGRESSIITNGIVSQYIDDAKKIAAAGLMDARMSLVQLQVRLERQLKTTQEESAQIHSKLQIDEAGHSSVRGEKEQLLFQLVTARVKSVGEAADAKAAFDAAQTFVQQGGVLPQVSRMVDQNPQVNYWRSVADQLDVDIKNQLQGDQAKALTDRRDVVKAKLNSIIAEQTANLPVSYLDQLNSRVAGTEHEKDELTSQIAKLQTDLSDLSSQILRYETSTKEMATLREIADREKEQVGMLDASRAAAEAGPAIWMIHAGTRYEH